LKDTVLSALHCITQHSYSARFLPQVCQQLFIAAASGDLNTVKILFSYTKDKCTKGFILRDTPLIYAAIFGHVEVVRVLLEGGADVESANAYRSTALHQAAWNGHLEVCRLLLDWGAKVDAVDEWKDTPLHVAAWAGHLSVVKLLVARGADVRLKNDRGLTASGMARSEGREDVAVWLFLVSCR
jgi:ankyrin repeat protein